MRGYPIVEVDLNRARNNATLIKNRSGGKKIWAVVKQNAYGHGSVAVAQSLIDLVDGFVVANVQEALELRDSGIMTDILALSPPDQRQAVELKDLDCIAVLSNESQLAFLQKGQRLHLQFDMGMNRLGLPVSELEKWRTWADEQDKFEIEGVLAHFSCADAPEHPHNEAALEKAHSIDQAFAHLPERHFGNTDATLNLSGLPGTSIRVGLALYGYGNEPGLQPIKTCAAPIVEVHPIKKGESVSYGAKWTADADGFVAVVACGYGDGLFRKLSHHIKSYNAQGEVFSVVGAITMDFCMVFSRSISLQVGTYLSILCDAQTAEELAQYAETIPYEILCQLASKEPILYRKIKPLIKKAGQFHV